MARRKSNKQVKAMIIEARKDWLEHYEFHFFDEDGFNRFTYNGSAPDDYYEDYFNVKLGTVSIKANQEEV